MQFRKKAEASQQNNVRIHESVRTNSSSNKPFKKTAL